MRPHEEAVQREATADGRLVANRKRCELELTTRKISQQLELPHYKVFKVRMTIPYAILWYAADANEILMSGESELDSRISAVIGKDIVDAEPLERYASKSFRTFRRRLCWRLTSKKFVAEVSYVPINTRLTTV